MTRRPGVTSHRPSLAMVAREPESKIEELRLSAAETRSAPGRHFTPLPEPLRKELT